MTAAAIKDLRRFADHRDLDARTLFRSTDPGLPGVSTDPYVSQFLLQPYTFGSTPTQQRYRTTVAGSDHLTSYDAWLAVQNGSPPPPPPATTPPRATSATAGTWASGPTSTSPIKVPWSPA